MLKRINIRLKLALSGQIWSFEQINNAKTVNVDCNGVEGDNWNILNL